MNKRLYKPANKALNEMHSGHFIKLFCGMVMMSPVTGFGAPDPSPDPNASTVYLRATCNIANVDGSGEGTIENCFESMGGSLGVTKWIYARANPQKLLIDIGPGIFEAFNCSQKPGGELSFRGAGADKTVINGVGNRACSNANWTFSDLTVKGIPSTSNNHAVIWLDAGFSSWNNVVLEATGGGFSWYDAGGSTNSGTGGLSEGQCLPGEQGTHRFSAVRLITRASTNSGNQGEGSIGFLNRCGDNWFWGSEIVFTPAPGGKGTAISSEGSASRIHLYGSNIRAEADPTATSGSVTAIHVRDGAEVHAHGVGIDVLPNLGMTGTALDAGTNGQIHASASSYFVSPSTGITFRRIVNNGGHVHAPYQWEHIPTQTFESVTGADTATVTLGTSDAQPHLVIYSKTCPGGASGWYDTTDKVCR